jgi:hypothetical protein
VFLANSGSFRGLKTITAIILQFCIMLHRKCKHVSIFSPVMRLSTDFAGDSLTLKNRILLS